MLYIFQGYQSVGKKRRERERIEPRQHVSYVKCVFNYKHGTVGVHGHSASPEVAFPCHHAIVSCHLEERTQAICRDPVVASKAICSFT